MDGMEVLQRLRARRGGGPAVIILTAARREAEDIERGLRFGAEAYLTKPIDGRELRARVRGALDVHKLRMPSEKYRRHRIAMLVHDLRHPLSSLALVAALLESEDFAPDERRRSVETIRRMCSDMSRLVDGVLMASRLEAANLRGGARARAPRSGRRAVARCLRSGRGEPRRRARVAWARRSAHRRRRREAPPSVRQPPRQRHQVRRDAAGTCGSAPT